MPKPEAKSYFVFGFQEYELGSKSVNRLNAFFTYFETGHFDNEAAKKKEIEKVAFDYPPNSIRIANEFTLPVGDAVVKNTAMLVADMKGRLQQEHVKTLQDLKKLLGDKKYDVILFDRHTQGFLPHFDTGLHADSGILYGKNLHKEFDHMDAAGHQVRGDAIWTSFIDFLDLVLSELGKKDAYLILDTGNAFDFPTRFKIEKDTYDKYGGYAQFNQRVVEIINKFPDNTDDRGGYQYIKYQKGVIQRQF